MLKTKPQTKYFAGGYISFKTIGGVLSYQIIFSTKRTQFPYTNWEKVKDESHLQQLLATKSREQLLTTQGERQL